MAAFFSSSILGRKGFAGSFNWTTVMTKFSYRGFHHQKRIAGSITRCFSSSSSTSTSCSSPWLMLPPGRTKLHFYSLAENTVHSVPLEKEISHVLPKLDFVGSSHGWLGLYNPYNLDLFLYNPLSRRRVDLPPVRTLTNIPKSNFERGCGVVVKLILSCDPEREDCRAMMNYNSNEQLAFCCPGRSKEWTPIGQLYDWREGGWKTARSYLDFVYSEKQRAFFCLSNGCDLELESWDLRDPCSPWMTPMYQPGKWVSPEPPYESESESEDEDEDDDMEPDPDEERHLVVADSKLLVVHRKVMPCVDTDGAYLHYFQVGAEDCAHKTIDFDVLRFDPQKRDYNDMDSSSLGGLALFVGFHNHSVALSTSEFPELKPNSIYFADPFQNLPRQILDHDDGFDVECKYRGHDIGIFNYQDKTFSPCYYPCDVGSFKKMEPAPMWFFPSQT